MKSRPIKGGDPGHHNLGQDEGRVSMKGRPIKSGDG